jgi:quinol monooxygenase YgiN
MARFVQIVEFQTSRPDEVRALNERFRSETEGKRTADRVTVTQDRDRPGTIIIIAEFPSYEEAMKNSELPETQRISEEMMKLSDNGATFRNLDVTNQM